MTTIQGKPTTLTNMETGHKTKFPSMVSAYKFLGITLYQMQNSNGKIVKRASTGTKFLVEYDHEKYVDQIRGGATPCCLTNTLTGEKHEFRTLTDAAKFLGRYWNPSTVRSKHNLVVRQNDTDEHFMVEVKK